MAVLGDDVQGIRASTTPYRRKRQLTYLGRQRSSENGPTNEPEFVTKIASVSETLLVCAEVEE